VNSQVMNAMRDDKVCPAVLARFRRKEPQRHALRLATGFERSQPETDVVVVQRVAERFVGLLALDRASNPQQHDCLLAGADGLCFPRRRRTRTGRRTADKMTDEHRDTEKSKDVGSTSAPRNPLQAACPGTFFHWRSALSRVRSSG